MSKTQFVAVFLWATMCAAFASRQFPPPTKPTESGTVDATFASSGEDRGEPSSAPSLWELAPAASTTSLWE
jgi:hypothetical protein